MIAEWFLIAIIAGADSRGSGGTSVPMQSQAACITAAKTLKQIVFRPHVYCINTATGEAIRL